VSRSRSNRSKKLEDEADKVYTIATPFQTNDAKILLIERDDDGIEVIVGNIPTPKQYDTDKNYPNNLDNENTMRAHATAQWIVAEATDLFSEYDWKTSNYKTNKPNYHLKDIYFTCERSEVDDAVLTAKRFLTKLEEQSVKHKRHFYTLRRGPSEDL